MKKLIVAVLVSVLAMYVLVPRAFGQCCPDLTEVVYYYSTCVSWEGVKVDWSNNSGWGSNPVVWDNKVTWENSSAWGDNPVTWGNNSGWGDNPVTWASCGLCTNCSAKPLLEMRHIATDGTIYMVLVVAETSTPIYVEMSPGVNGPWVKLFKGPVKPGFYIIPPTGKARFFRPSLK